jgi:hypothetical protein
MEISFENAEILSRTEIHYTMRARLKKSGPKGATSVSTPLKSLSVRCLHSPSRCSLRGNCTRATDWRWYIADPQKLLKTEDSKFGEWRDCSVIPYLFIFLIPLLHLDLHLYMYNCLKELFGGYTTEAEVAFLDGSQNYSFKLKLPEAAAAQTFTFDFDSMLCSVGLPINNSFELLRRPAAIPRV